MVSFIVTDKDGDTIDIDMEVENKQVAIEIEEDETVACVVLTYPQFVRVLTIMENIKEVLDV